MWCRVRCGLSGLQFARNSCGSGFKTDGVGLALTPCFFIKSERVTRVRKQLSDPIERDGGDVIVAEGLLVAGCRFALAGAEEPPELGIFYDFPHIHRRVTRARAVGVILVNGAYVEGEQDCGRC